MKRCLFILFFFLTACGPTATQQQDLFVAQALAEQQSETYALMLTGTAQAPILNITVEAAHSLATDQASMKTETASVAQTQAAWTPSPVPTSTPNATATIGAAQVYAIQTSINLKTESDKISNTFYSIIWPIFMLVILILIGIITFTYVRDHRHKVVPSNVPGDKPIIVNTVTGELVDMDAMPNYSSGKEASLLEQMFVQYMERNHGFKPQLPMITAERQDAVKMRDQMIDLRSRAERLPKALLESQGTKFLNAPVGVETPPLLGDSYPEVEFPHWKLLNQWDGKLLPFGVDEKSKLMTVDTSSRAHLMFVGRSRSGKTLTGERTEVACLLTQGWNVIVMGKRVDWMPFEDHPNFKLIAVDVRKDAQKYIDVLQVMTAQMDVRDQLMASKRVSTWDRYGAPSTMIVLDDYSGAMIRMPKAKAAEVLTEVRDIAMDGAKFGLSLTIGLQDATWQNIDTTVRSQMARIVYSLDSAGKSRVALGEDGAERLPPYRHFLTKITDDSNVEHGVGFFLEDREVEAFLASRPVQENENIDWVDGQIVGQGQLSAANDTEELPEPKMNVDEARAKAEEITRVLDLHAQGDTDAAIVRKIWGVTGGGPSYKLKDKVREILEKYGTSSTSSPDLSPKMGLQGAD